MPFEHEIKAIETFSLKFICKRVNSFWKDEID